MAFCLYGERFSSQNLPPALLICPPTTSEWKGRSDGIVAHVFFKGSPNFAISVFAFAVEGWIFYSAVNSVVPQIVLRLGFETNAWRISVRQLSYNLVTLFASIPITLYATKYKDLKTPLLATFGIFLVVTICYATINPSLNHAQIGYNVLGPFHDLSARLGVLADGI